ncbi:MAG: aspartate--tRNA ligase, partial [Bacteroides sp.]
MLRRYTCNAINIKHINQNVVLYGWIYKIRNFGNIMFIDLKDKYGIIQLIVNYEIIESMPHLGLEYVIQVYGKVIERKSKNKTISTGSIEILVNNIVILNKSLSLPFDINNNRNNHTDDLKSKYRYLELRSDYLQYNLHFRNELNYNIRNFFYKKKFIEIETPFLIKSMPEGSRDFIIPSRIYNNKFYALPQSPQLLKQLLMIAKYDKYYQIVKCFRDEDFRSDRQPEFTQLDCEMTFINENNVMKLIENLITKLFYKMLNYKIDKFDIIKYKDAIKYYGTDKPDLRFDMKFIDFSKLQKNKNETLIGFNIENYNLKKNIISEIISIVKSFNNNEISLIFFDVKSNKYKTIGKTIPFNDLYKYAKLNKKDMIILVSGNIDDVRVMLSNLRISIGKIFIKNRNIYKAVWVTEFPLFQWDKMNNKWKSMHHPFTSPQHFDQLCNQYNLEFMTSKSYDIVINGIEIGGGSIRIHDYIT